jgi:sugar/nucleoside kinase (ribokinase family)
MAVPAALTQSEIVVVGEIYADHIFGGFESWPRPGEEVFARHYLRELGGGTVNTACGLSRLGRRTRLLGLIGEHDRDWFEQRLGEFGLSADGLRDSPAGTGVTASVSLREDRSFFTYLGANAGLQDLLREQQVITALCAARHVHFAMPLPATLARTLLPALAAAGCSTSLDVGFNPDWLANPENQHTCRSVDWFLPNRQEAALLGCGDGTEACLHWARTFGLRQAVIKLGADGAMAIDANGARIVPAPTLQARDTTGAGDAFDAGFIDALLDGAPLDDCVRRGCLCGAACCTALGALDGLPDFNQLRTLYEQHVGS